MSHASPTKGRPSVTVRSHPPPICEGWLDKYALCRGVFASKGWHRRYAFLTNEGIGFCHSNPRGKGTHPPHRPLKASVAKTFIPFVRRRHGEVELEPVYVLDDVSAARHPAVPQRSNNGICSENVSSAEGGASSRNASAGDVAKAGGGACSTFYYFGLSFEEHHKRYLLLLRTNSPQDYIRWTTYLPLYVHEGSATRLVPLGHPLEAGRPQPMDVNYRRLTGKKESTLPSTVTFYFDPDPCTTEEYEKVRRLCLGWDEGEREHLFYAAAHRVERLCTQTDSTATESLTEMQVQSEEDHRRDVEHQFDVLGPGVAVYEAQYSSPLAKGSNAAEASTSSTYPQQQSRHVDAADVMADDVSASTWLRNQTHTFAASASSPLSQKQNKHGRGLASTHNVVVVQRDVYSEASV